jgi:hypothetical protein
LSKKKKTTTTTKEQGRNVAQVVECLPSTHNDLGSIPSKEMEERRERRKEERREGRIKGIATAGERRKLLPPAGG